MSNYGFINDFTVKSDKVKYTDEFIESDYIYHTTDIDVTNKVAVVSPKEKNYVFRTERKVPKIGAMIVGWGGNNGTTVTAGIVANRENLEWATKAGEQKANYFGSLTQCSVLRIGSQGDSEIHVPFNKIIPMVSPNDLVLGGWDISKVNMGDAMRRAQVIDYDLQNKVYPFMKEMKPLPSIYYPDFIAANQEDRADNIIPGSKKLAHLEHIRKDIREFKEKNKLDKVIVLWSANTERYSDVLPGLNDTWKNLENSLKENKSEISPSTIFALAAIMEGSTFINGSPQNALVPGVLELAKMKKVLVAGDDFKTGQTKFKSVLADFLVSSGIKPVSIVSYNHLGNNDGKNLSAPKQFRSKEISKSGVVDDMVESNRILFPNGEKPDHCVVIKYVPYVQDSKRALDEYTSEIFLGGHNTIVVHNTCEDSLLAAPVIIDLIVLGELVERISYKTGDMKEFARFHPVLSILGFLLKAPLVPEKTPVVNALFKQRACIENILRACVGLPPENNMSLEFKCIPY